MGPIAERLRQHRVIAVDTCVWIYHLEQNPRLGECAAEILTAVASGDCHAVASELTLMELITGPLKLERQDVADEYELLLSNYPNLTLLPITRPILLRAAALRASYGFKTPDAIVLATAQESSASLIVTNDQSWPSLSDIQILSVIEMGG